MKSHTSPLKARLPLAKPARTTEQKGSIALGAIAVILLFLLWFLLTTIWLAPIFMGGLWSCAGIVLLYVFTENAAWKWHSNHESENRFWTTIACVATLFTMFAPDSPFAVGRLSAPLGFLIAFGVANGVHYWDRRLSRNELVRPLHLSRVKSVLLLDEQGAKDKVRIIQTAVDSLDYKVVVLKSFNIDQIATQTQLIMETIENCNEEELNYVLTNVNLSLLFYKVKDRDLMTLRRNLKKSRTQLLDMLVSRVNELSVPARAALIDALQNMRISAHAKGEIWVSAIFLATFGVQLTLLKTATDTKGGAQNLHKLIYADLRSQSIRNELLAHFRNEANTLLRDWGTEPAHFGFARSYRNQLQQSQQIALARLAAIEAKKQQAKAASKPEPKRRGSIAAATAALIGSGSANSSPTAAAAAAAVATNTSANASAAAEAASSSHVRASSADSKAIDQRPTSLQQPLNDSASPGVARMQSQSRLLTNRHLRMSSNVDQHLDLEKCNEVTLGSSSGTNLKMLALTRPRKILSDVDDTMLCSGGKFPAGIDTTLPHHTLYFGVLTFYKELDLGLESCKDGFWSKGRAGNLAFLSARPHVYKDKSEKKSYLRFETLRNKAGTKLHAIPTLLAGDLDSGVQMFRGNYEPLAQKKFDNFAEFAALYPEFSFCFVGDNGQADVMAAEMMHSKFTEFEAAFIHQVQPIHKTPGYDDTACDRWAAKSIFFFKTYIGAAVAAAKIGIIHPKAVRRIALDAIRELKEMEFSLHEQDARRVELNEDIEQANAYFESIRRELWLSGDHEDVEPIALIPAANVFPVGCYVSTSFGVGKILAFRPDFGIYEIQLTSWKLAGDQPVFVYAHGRELNWWIRGEPGTAVWTPYGTGILESVDAQTGVHRVVFRQRDVRSDASVPIGYLQPECVQPIKAAVGDKVSTNFGPGVVCDFRPEDNITVVSLDWTLSNNQRALAYLNADSFQRAEAVANKSRCSVM